MDAGAKRPGGGGSKVDKILRSLLWMVPYWALSKEHINEEKR